MFNVVTTNRLNRDFTDLMNDFFRFPGNNAEKHDFTPRVNIRETKDDVRLTFELPGMDKKDVKIMIAENTLTVSGERIFESEKKEDDFVRNEIFTGSFSRSFTLPETIDAEKISAEYKNGLLEITLAKKEEVKPKEIEVKVS
jgi:HSP20 family protein